MRATWRMRECGPEIKGRLPDGIVEVRRAFADRSVKLGGDDEPERTNSERLDNGERRTTHPNARIPSDWITVNGEQLRPLN
jgi:hypothetical protein